jgi:DNA-binding IclR family transcriptional regulator
MAGRYNSELLSMSELRTQSVPALERGLRILECLAESQHGLTLSQITRAMQLPKSTVHCILLTFERSNYIQRDESSGRYRLGLGLFRLANVALPALWIREQAAQVLHSLMERTRLTVHMAALDYEELVLIARVSPPGSAAPASWVGKRMDFHCTALGKAVLSCLEESEIERLIRKHGMLRHNDNTIASLRRLLLDLEQSRRRGYAVDDEEEEIGVRCLGAPILGPDGRVEAAVSVVGTTNSIDSEAAPSLASLVVDAARSISARLVSSAPAEAAASRT